ncbi:MAG: hypothetical protein H7233_06135, partial [Pseudorhodobacter sp.]|nr:hypothetical protein [Frankiaceae bacterium]
MFMAPDDGRSGGTGSGDAGLTLAPTAGPLLLLRSGVPLTLLLDLADPAGPRSELIYSQERDTETAVWWVAPV